MKKTKAKKVIIIALIIISILGLSVAIYADSIEKTTITCEDINLYKALKNALEDYIVIGSSDESTKSFSIPTQDIESITKLNLTGSNTNKITSIKGVENFTGLKELNLSANNITDITPISNLNNLMILNLNGNKIENLSTLSNKIELTELYLSTAGVSDISFVSNLTKLKTLDISNNTISNLQAIQNLENLTKLNVSSNKNLTTIADIVLCKSLNELDISNTAITVYEGIEGLGGLTSLNASNLSPKTSSALSAIVKTYQTKENGKTVTKAYLENLEKLNLNSTKGLQVSNLKYLIKLKELYMENNDISNLSGITDLEELEYIDFANNKIAKLDPFVVEKVVDGEKKEIHLTATQIILNNNLISDLSIFQKLTNVRHLNLDKNKISEIGPLEGIRFDSNGLSLRNQTVEFSVYQKSKKNQSDVLDDQYIILPSLLQSSKQSGSLAYSENAEFEVKGATLNNESTYQVPGNYNIIISKEKTSNDKELTSVTLHGGIADGSVMSYKIATSSSSIESIRFEDEKLDAAIYKKIAEKQKNVYLKRVPKIINITQSEIADTKELNLSDGEISNLRGLANFYNLNILNLSGNKINNIDELATCVNIQDLNVSNSPITNNNSSIMGMTKLLKLDLANTGMTNIENINKYVEELQKNNKKLLLEQLNISNNTLDNVSGIEKLTTLQQLHMAETKTSNIEKLANLVNLKTLNISGNGITDITTLNELRNLIFLNFSNNKVQDISPIGNLSSLTELNFSGNRVKDISSLSGISGLTKLDMDSNLIDDVSPILNKLIKDQFSARNQKVVKVIEEDARGQLEFDLPQIIKSSMQPGSKVYTLEDLKTRNCELSADKSKVIVNVDELGDNIATVTIKDGAADGTKLSIAPSLKGELHYNIIEKTNKDVVASIKFNRSDVTIINNDGKNEYTFTDNGEFTFEYIDDYGFEGTTKAVVNWIDKVAPKLQVKQDILEGGKVKVQIIADEKILLIDGWTLSQDGLTLTKVYTDNSNERLRISDEVGNITEVDIEVKIDKTPPVIKGVKEGEKYQQAVTPIIEDENLDKVTLTKDGTVVPNYQSGTMIKEKGKYVLTAVDKNGNTTTVSFEIENLLDKITSDTYNIDETKNTVGQIKPNTTVNDIKNNIQNEMNYQILDNKGQAISDTSKVGTGYQIKMENGRIYTLAVLGDLNGDTKVNILDVARLQKIVAGTIKLSDVTDIVKLASDIKEDDKLNLLDLARIQKLATGQNIF